ncbi:hypothetical protein CBR_g2913 [Chara braunii]|uniref:Uncharacterized protein n=1 Tax=Chara braunii TaxID=69332 RepID=A0A388KE87_CHABU|nr:hypothetical protein CBR_g2913 [Chara braunii]|eukprot:GBG68370.1 hypothetical protein CBR_g2913 [Chara braunii]
MRASTGTSEKSSGSQAAQGKGEQTVHDDRAGEKGKENEPNPEQYMDISTTDLSREKPDQGDSCQKDGELPKQLSQKLPDQGGPGQMEGGLTRQISTENRFGPLDVKTGDEEEKGEGGGDGIAGLIDLRQTKKKMRKNNKNDQKTQNEELGTAEGENQNQNWAEESAEKSKESKEQENSAENRDPFKEVLGFGPMDWDASPPTHSAPLPPPRDVIMSECPPEGTDERNSDSAKSSGGGAEHTEGTAAQPQTTTETKLMALTDWLILRLQESHPGQTTKFWDNSFIELFELLDSSSSLKGILENRAPQDIPWAVFMEKILSKIQAGFSCPQTDGRKNGPAEESQQASSPHTSVPSQAPEPLGEREGKQKDGDRGTTPEMVETVERAEEETTTKRMRLRHLVEKGQHEQKLSIEGVLVLPIRKKEGKWQAGMTKAAGDDKYGGVTLQGWLKEGNWMGYQVAQALYERTAREFIARKYEPGACATYTVASQPHRVAGKDLYVKFDATKEAGMRWYIHQELLELQILKVKPSKIWSERDLMTILCSILKQGILLNTVNWEGTFWERL